MSWYYHRSTGEIAEATGFKKWSIDREIDLEKTTASVTSGAVPQMWYGPFASKANAEAFKASNPTYPDMVKKNVGGAVGGAVSDVTSAISSFGNQLVKIALRLLEGAAGIVLLAIAANVILKQSTGVDVAGRAFKGGKQAAKLAAA